MGDRQVDAVIAALRAGVSRAAAEYAVEITANLVADCPVKTGHLRANFVPSVGVPFTGEAGSRAEQDAGIVAVLSSKAGDELFVTNNAPYLGPIINGSSDQAPPGWDLAAIDRATATMQARYAALDVDVTSPRGGATERGAGAAGNLASAYSPLGGEE